MKQGAVVGCAAEALPAAETAEAEQGQRSVFCESAATLEAKAGHRNPEEGGLVFSCSAALPFNASFLFPFFRSAGARGPGRGFRLPLPRPSGLPTLPNDQGRPLDPDRVVALGKSLKKHDGLGSSKL